MFAHQQVVLVLLQIDAVDHALGLQKAKVLLIKLVAVDSSLLFILNQDLFASLLLVEQLLRFFPAAFLGQIDAQRGCSDHTRRQSYPGGRARLDFGGKVDAQRLEILVVVD